MKNVKPMISVIIPMYKVEPYIKICIDSVLNQTFQDFEIIIIDDASPDNCYSICQQLYSNNEKVTLMRHKVNQSQAIARNTGLKKARGKYIFFLDSDDLLLPNALEELYKVAEQSGAEVIHTNSWYEIPPNTNPIDGKLQVVLRSESNPQYQGYLTNDIKKRLTEDWVLRSWSMPWLNFYRFDFLKKHNMKFIQMISEDEAFNFTTFCFAETFLKVTLPVYVYRRRNDSTMGNKNLERFSRVIKAIVTCISYMKNVMKEVPSIAKDTAFKNFCINRMIDVFFKNHIFLYYQDGTVSAELDEVTSRTFTEIFGSNMEFVRQLFHGYNIFNQRLLFEINENQKLRQIVAKIAK